MGDDDLERDFPPIGALAAIGDGHSLALVGPDAAIEWFCPGRFDQPPLVWPLLDRRRGGRLHIAPCEGRLVRAGYLADTALLVFDWDTPGGALRLTLGMDYPGEPERQCLLWRLEALAGRSACRVQFEPRPAFGQGDCRTDPAADGLVLVTGDQRLQLQTDCPLQAVGQGWEGELTVAPGRPASVCLQIAPAGAPPLPEIDVADALSASIAAWRNWCARLDWSGRYRQAVVRSAICLKLLIYQPTGGVVAAATTSLPEAMGYGRNWDYRYTWFRDAGLTLGALFALGCRAEAGGWAGWMQRVIARHGLPLRIFYTLDGEPPPAERELDLQGYRDAAPVRVGNAAQAQHQLDIYGELLDCVHICDSMGADNLLAHWPHLCQAADFIAAHWREPDSGIWEVRSAPRQFVHSKVMAWTGLQRALWLQRRHGLPGPCGRWEDEARQIREQVMRCGVSADRRHFIRAYDDPGMDASLLLIARTGFVSPHSPLFRNTVDEVCRRLQVAGRAWAIRRYEEGTDDGLSGREGAFTLCGFWLVEALVLVGRRPEAERLFRQMLTLQGRFGLLGEETDPETGAQLGNVPQAFSHVGLINAALRLADRSPMTDELIWYRGG